MGQRSVRTGDAAGVVTREALSELALVLALALALMRRGHLRRRRRLVADH